jgi:mono/diheme cytochrome c family protein
MELIRFSALAIFVVLAGCDSDSNSGASDLGLQEQIGLEFVQKRGCMTCHGDAKSSNGAMAGSSEPVTGTTAYAPNLTPDTATGIGGWADIEIVRAMRYGIDEEQDQLCPTMPHYDGSDPMYPFMTDVEADAIVAYLRSLKPVNNEVPESMCPPIKPRPPVDMAAPPATDDMNPVDHD